MSTNQKSLAESGALRQLKHNDGSEGFVFAYDKEITDRYIAQLLKVQAPSAPVAPDEQAAFEVWAELTIHQRRGERHDVVGWYYFDDDTNTRWEAWQARAALSVKAETAAIPQGYALTLIDQSYDQRVKAIIAHNQCRGDLDEKLKAAYEAAVYASPTPPQSGETPP